ncbi:uncharacterized protein [Nicotiana sylvestris]|uniref:uncharacterized protein n=1 Tax=Nicotiana sylvestris TaxID=4096 RepID=UPI00388C9F7D
MDLLKYIFQKPIPTGKLAKWQILLSEFDIVYVTQKAIKGQTLADHFAENPMDREYEPLKMYFPDEEVSFIGEDIVESYDGWRMFFDGVANFKGVGIGALLVSKTDQHYPVSTKLSDRRFEPTYTSSPRRMGDQELQDTSIFALCTGIEKEVHKDRIPTCSQSPERVHDALATLSSIIQHPDKNFVDPTPVRIRDQPAYFAHVEEEADGKSWFHDIKELAKGKYPELENPTQKCTLRRLSNNFFHSGGILYRSTPDLGLLRCVDAKEASRLLEEIHAGTCSPHMKGFVLAKKILRADYFLMTMETDCIQYVRKFHR